MAIMGLAIVAAMRVVSYQINVVDAQTSGIEARQQAEKGIAIAANPVVEKWDPLLRQGFEDGTGFEASIQSEGKAFNINYVLQSGDKALLRLIFDHWGIDYDVSSGIVDALVDWIDPNDNEEVNGAEIDWYENEGFINQPYNRPFYDLDEMRLVRGMDVVEAANPNWREWFTIWSSGGLDVTAASAEYLAIAAEVDIEDAIPVVDYVEGPDGIQDTEDDTPLSVDEALTQMGVFGDETGTIRNRFSSNDSTDRIESIGFSGDVRRKIVLIIRNRSGNPQILDRREELVK
ncbi:MAG: general secretion pathway protein GspK [Verrucomicrobiaceae bacterium]